VRESIRIGGQVDACWHDRHVPVLRATALIDSSARTVAGLLRDARVEAAALERAGHRVTAGSRLLSPGDDVELRLRMVGFTIRLRMTVEAISEEGMTVARAGGLLPELRSTARLIPTGAGTLLLDELRWTSPLGPLGRVLDVVLGRRIVLRTFAQRSQELVARAATLADAPVVVATALVRDGRVLAAQRTRPPHLAGQWELPGGRVEPGETEAQAVVRECREELGVEVRVTARLGTDLPLDSGVLRVHIAELAPESPGPQALDHAELRWADPDDVAALDWVDADRAVVADLVTYLRSRANS
jgi:8-oxo-dGTP diphosphatase